MLSFDQGRATDAKNASTFVKEKKSPTKARSIVHPFHAETPILLTHKWTIEHFSEVYDRIRGKAKYIISNSFSLLENDDKIEFYLILEPAFRCEGDTHIAPYLHYKHAHKRKIPVRCEFSIIDANGRQINPKSTSRV